MKSKTREYLKSYKDYFDRFAKTLDDETLEDIVEEFKLFKKSIKKEYKRRWLKES